MNGEWGLNYFRSAGSDVGVEASDPNTDATNPFHADGAALRPRAFIYSQASPPSTKQIFVAVQNGTSLVVEVWAYDSGLGRWIKIGGDTCLAGVAKVFTAIPGAFHFVRVTTNNGNVQSYGVGSL